MCVASHIGGLNRRAMQALNNGNAANAEFLLCQALHEAQARSLMGFIPRLHSNLGLIFLFTGRPVQAVDQFTKALNLSRARYAGATRFHEVVRRQLDQARQEAQTIAV